MLLKALTLLSVWAVVCMALPPYENSYGEPSGPGKYGKATVTSYNRRGAAALAKPDIYGASYGHQAYDNEPEGYGHKVSSYSKPSSYDIRPESYDHKPSGYESYGQQSEQYAGHPAYGVEYPASDNAYGAQVQSHDPHYDAAKDPVSQYAAYIPTREYGAKGHSNGNELSIYGYRK